MFDIPTWVFEFHGHKCPMMPLGYRMGALALKVLEEDRMPDHGLWVVSEMGVRHPQGCLNDGLQAVTGCTYGKGLIRRLHYGKYAAIIFHPQKTAIRIVVKPEYIDTMHHNAAEFFNYRQKGLQPSQIPEEVADRAIQPILEASDDEMFIIQNLPGLKLQKLLGSWQRAKCDKCGEYVFELYVRIKDGQDLCIPCLGEDWEPYNEPPVRLVET